MSFAVVVLLLAARMLAVTAVEDTSNDIDDPKAEALYDDIVFKEKLFRMSYHIESTPHLKADFEKHAKGKEIVAPPADFTCNVTEYTSAEIPTSVHQLRPGDIKVVAAFGDSITAGNGLGATTLPQVAVENRGESFSIGGDESLEGGVITLPNIMRKFNPDLKGYSRCASTEDNVYRSWFNVARPGATNDDMLSEAKDLVERMKVDKLVNYEEDWKLLTFLVGGNDLCGSCEGKHSAEQFYDWFNQTLTYLSGEMPRTLVNLVSMFDVSPLQNLSTGYACDLLQWGFCACARNWTTLPALRTLQLEYHEQYVKLANDSRFNNRDDFAVVVQHHMRDMIPPTDANGNYLPGYLSPDCFHPNRISHQGFAVWLWNTMLIPVNQKPYSVDTNNQNVPISCPSEEYPYIFTNANSDVPWPPAGSVNPPAPVISSSSALSIHHSYILLVAWILKLVST